MEPEVHERLISLESKVAHLERLYDELNQVVIEQARSVARMQGLNQRISSMLESIELERIKAGSGKPPHYQ